MSSETSIEELTSRAARASDADPGLQAWQLFTLAGLMGATVVVFLSTGHTPAGIILLSLTIFTAATVGVAVWRTLAPFTGGVAVERPAVVLGGRTRAALERDKALVLRAIKELEFDRAMGKVSEADFTEMGARLRARAARLIRQLDAGSDYRDEIEKEIARRLGNVERAAHHASPVPAATLPGAPTAVPVPVLLLCGACGKGVDPDARFCKHCGSPLEQRQ